MGIGSVALASLLARNAAASGTPGLPGLPHHPPKAKRVVMLWQGGGPSHIDLFDPKPVLMERGGQDVPESVRGSTRLSTMSSGYVKWPVVSPIKPFTKYGRCGTEMSTLLPHLGGLADDLCLVRSMNTEAVNHAPGVTFFLTGSQVPGRPHAFEGASVPKSQMDGDDDSADGARADGVYCDRVRAHDPSPQPPTKAEAKRWKAPPASRTPPPQLANDAFL
jgi:hypothetical protein